MSEEFKFPDLGEGITEGEIKKWLVNEGDEVEKDQPLVEVETDKAVVEIPSPYQGKISKLHFGEGEMVEVGSTLVTFGEGPSPQVSEVEEAPKERRSVSVVGELPEAEEVETLAIPKIRALAKERGVDISKIKGSGPKGRVVEADLPPSKEGVKEKKKLKKKPKFDMYGWVDRRPLRGLRRTIAKNLIESQTRTAAVTTMDMADVTDLVALRNEHKTIAQAERGVKLTFMPFIMKAVVEALREYPILNSSVDDENEEIVIKKYFNIGIAVATEDGLIVPVVKGVDQKSIYDLAEEVQKLASQAQERKLDLGDLKGGTFTITNYGVFGGMFGTPIINYPEVAILGTGRIIDMPMAVEGEVKVRKVIHLSLTFDHRATDGAEAQRFLNSLIKHLEDPMTILFSA